MVNEVNVRYSAPSKYDIANHGTIFKVMGENNSYELFVQCSSNLESPEWKPINYLLEKTFHDFLTDKDFISLCLCLSSGDGDRHEHFKSLSKLLSK